MSKELQERGWDQRYMRPGSSRSRELGVWLNGEWIPTFGKLLEAGCQECKPEREETGGNQLVKEGWRRAYPASWGSSGGKAGWGYQCRMRPRSLCCPSNNPHRLSSTGKDWWRPRSQHQRQRAVWKPSALVRMCACASVCVYMCLWAYHLHKTNKFLKAHFETSDV